MTDTKRDGWVYVDADSAIPVYRASTLGSCLRSLVSARCGESAFPFNAAIQAAMDASSGLEDVILNRIIAELGGELIWQQKEVELSIGQVFKTNDGQSFIKTEWNSPTSPLIRGHIDALRQDDDTIIEAKALGPANFAKYNSGGLDALGNLGKKYRWQGAIYGHATGRKVRFVIGEKVKTEGELKDDSEYVGPATWEIDNLIIEPPVDPQSLVPLEEIVARVQEVERYAAEDVLPECTDNCKPGDPYEECHIFASINMGGQPLEDLLAEYHSLTDTIKDMQDHKDSIRDQLVNEYGIGKHAAGPFSMNIVKVMSSRFDVKWLKKNQPDVYAQGCVPSESIRVNVTSAKERDESSDSGSTRVPSGGGSGGSGVREE